MATVTTPWGAKLEETNPVALAYYERQAEYTVSYDEPAAAASGPSTAKAAASSPAAVSPPPAASS